MPVIISMLRGVNVGGHNKIKMDALKALYESLKFDSVETHIQSGNVIFRTKEKNIAALTKRIQDAIERKFGFRPDVFLRTASEMREAITRNPFAKRRNIDPSRLLVTFLAAEPSAEGRANLLKINMAPDEVRIDSRELYAYYPNGLARPKVPWAKIERTLKTSGTGRNWNSVNKLLEIAEDLEALK
jgi:uncharacterized protein (DUF1697 family)